MLFNSFIVNVSTSSYVWLIFSCNFFCCFVFFSLHLVLHLLCFDPMDSYIFISHQMLLIDLVTVIVVCAAAVAIYFVSISCSFYSLQLFFSLGLLLLISRMDSMDENTDKPTLNTPHTAHSTHQYNLPTS